MIRPTVEIYFDGAWVDVTGYTYDLRIRRGRAFELESSPPGSCEALFRNHTGVFLPTDLADPRLQDDAGTNYLYDDSGTEILLTDTGLFGYGQIVPGKQIRVTFGSTVVYTGKVGDWQLSYDVKGRADAAAVAYDVLADLGGKTFTEWTTTDYQRVSDRLDDVLDRAEVDYTGTRTFDTGLVVLQSDYVSWGSNVLNYLQLVAQTDQGRLFATTADALRYRARDSVAGATSQITFADDGTGAPFVGLDLSSASEYLWNRFTIDRLNGTAQTADDATSQTAYGIRSYGLGGLLMDNDLDALNTAELLVDVYADPRVRLGRVSVIPDTLTAGQLTALYGLELGDVVTVTWTPTGAYEPTSLEYEVEGVEIGVQLSAPAVFDIRLSPLPQATDGWFILDDATSGKLDTATVSF